MLNREGEGHWVVYYTSPQRFIITFSYSLPQQLWELLLNFFWMVHLTKCPNVLTTNINPQKGYFCAYHWGYTSIYRPLSYPFRSMNISTTTADQLLDKEVGRAAT